jgi:hypothetical protein
VTAAGAPSIKSITVPIRYDKTPKSNGNVRSSLSVIYKSISLFLIHIHTAVNGKKVAKSRQINVNIKKPVPPVTK